MESVNWADSFIPCFDLIMVGDPEPVILFSEKETNEILSERSNIWVHFSHSLNQKDMVI